MLKTKTKILPTPGRILVRREEAEAKSQGGILLPEVAKRAVNRGTVEAVGAPRTTEQGARIEMTVGKGDTIVFSPYGLHEIEEGLFVMSEQDVLAVLK